MPNSKWPRHAAIAVACLGATAAIGTASASATTVAGENIYGMGSSLQSVVQTGASLPSGSSGNGVTGVTCPSSGFEPWPGWLAEWDNCHHTTNQSSLNNNPLATYTIESSGQGLGEFGDATSGTCAPTAGVLSPSCDPTAGPLGELDAFVGTDDPPNSADLADGTSASGGVAQITVPVTQAPVAIVLSLPAGITLETSGVLHLSSQVLADVYSGTLPTSSQCPSDPGGTWCDLFEAAGLTRITTGTPNSKQFKDTTSNDGGPVTLYARSKGSGTTYSLRGYLYELDGYGQTSAYPYTLVADGPTGWPVSVCETAGVAPCPSSFGTTGYTANGSGANLVADVTAVPGALGYANLADAAEAPTPYTNKATLTTAYGSASHQILYADVQNNTADGLAAVYASPAGSTTGAVNVYTGADIGINVSTCSAPSTARVVGCWLVPSTPEGPWGSASASTPGTIPSDADVYDHGASSTGTKADVYPIIAATYDVAWQDYSVTSSNLVNEYNDATCSTTGVTCATDAGNAVKSYLKYVTGTGQSNLSSGHAYYGALPSAIKTKAAAAAAAITP